MSDDASKPTLLGCLFAPFLFVGGMALMLAIVWGALASLMFVGVPGDVALVVVGFLVAFWIGGALSKGSSGGNCPDGRPDGPD
jgi:hypothetical protein